MLFILALFFVFYLSELSNQKSEDYSAEFRGKIVELSKTTRKYDKIILREKGMCFSVTDVIRRSLRYDLKIGDSLIKVRNSYCFIYKRENDTIYQNCDSTNVSIYIEKHKEPCQQSNVSK